MIKNVYLFLTVCNAVLYVLGFIQKPLKNLISGTCNPSEARVVLGCAEW